MAHEPMTLSSRRGARFPSERQLAVMTCAWIIPSTGPLPKRAPILAAAASVVSASRPASRASISLRSGVPWQKPMAGSRHEGATLRRVRVSTATSTKPALRTSATIASLS